MLSIHNRLLSFLSDIERSLAADDPSPSDGTWSNTRSVNYHMGLARLNLGVKTTQNTLARGSILLQSYLLADGTPCLKAALTWTGTESSTVRAIFSKPGVNWVSEARKVAAEWMGGPPSGIPASISDNLTTREEHEDHAEASLAVG